MTESQGREGRSGQAWLATSLVASGLFLGSGAQAAQIHPDRKPAESDSDWKVDHHRSDLHDDLRVWHHHVMKVPPDVHGYSAATSGMTHPAADLLIPQGTEMDSVRHWHHHHHHPMWTPPTPPPSTGGTSMTDPSTTPTSLPAPSGLQSSPTPAPEPSTIVSALALVGAIAWKRRSRG